jgi:hypothetical protein
LSVSFETVSATSEDRIRESDSYIDEGWDDSRLFNLVAANAEVQVLCPWQGNSLVTLSEAMNSFPDCWTPEDEPTLIMLVHNLLTNKKQETTPEEAEDDPQEENSTLIVDESESEELEVQVVVVQDSKKEEFGATEQNDENKITEVIQAEDVSHNTATSIDKENPHVSQTEEIDEKLAQKETEVSTSHELLTNESVITSETKVTTLSVAEAKTDVGPNNSGPEQSAQNVDNLVAEISTFSNSMGQTSAYSPKSPEAPIVKGGVSKNTVQTTDLEKPAQVSMPERNLAKDRLNEATTDAIAEVETEQHEQVLESPNIIIEKRNMIGIGLAQEISQLSDTQDIEPFVLPDNLEIVAESELIEPDNLIIKSLGKPNNITGLIDENEVFPDDVIAPQNHDIQIEGISPIEFIENDTIIFEDIADELIPEDNRFNLVSDSVSVLPEQSEAKNANSEQSIVISESLQQIENIVTQISERIEISEPETIEAAKDILDKIDEAVEKIDTNESFEAGAQEEVEEFITELLEKLGIEYILEQVGSLARIVIKLRKPEVTNKLQDNEEDEAVPQDTGTHEAIVQLLLGISTGIKNMAYACAIGKFALRLSFNFSKG